MHCVTYTSDVRNAESNMTSSVCKVLVLCYYLWWTFAGGM